MTEEQRDAAIRAAESEGISVHEPDTSAMEQEAKKFGTADVDYIFDQPPEELFAHLMPRYVTTQIFHALLESTAAEHAARMTATDAATKNAGDLIDSLSADDESGAAGGDHQGDYRDCERSSGAVKAARFLKNNVLGSGIAQMTKGSETERLWQRILGK